MAHPYLVMIMQNKRLVIFGYSGSIHIKKWAKSLAERGYHVRVISLDGDDIDGVDVIRFKRIGKLSYFIHAANASKAALEFKPDIVHVHYAGGYGIWGVKTKFHPLVLSVWGSDVETLPKSFFYRPFIRAILSQADKITATSNSLIQSTLKIQNDVLHKTTTIPFGVPIPEASYDFTDLKKPSAIYMKHLETIYAPDILIKATVIVVEKFQNFRLTICGDGSLKNSLQQLVQKLHLENHITFTGYIDNKKVYELIRKHHFMVMPSLKEGFGVAAVEAFACCRPVVATNVGGIPEIVTSGQNGFMVDPNNVEQLANAMMKMISDKEMMIEMGRNGYEVAKQKFDWKKCVDQMVDVYQSF